MILDSNYGPFQTLVSAVGSLTATVAAIALGFRKRASWEPSEQDVESGPQRVGSLLAAVAIAILWTQFRDSSHAGELSRWAIVLAAGCTMFLLAYGLLIGTQTYQIQQTSVGGPTRRNVIGGFALTDKAKREADEQHLTIQQVLERFNYDCDRVWPRSSRSLAKLLTVVFYLGLTVCGTAALACASILVSTFLAASPNPNPIPPPAGTPPNTVHFNRTFHFTQPSFNISAPTPPNFGGFTSLERDASLKGRVKVIKIRMLVEATSRSSVGFGDLWAFLGPQKFTGKQSQRPFPVGTATWGDIITYPWDLVNDDAPTQVKLACGRPQDQPMPTTATWSVTFDFTTHNPSAEPYLGCSRKSSINDPMFLDNGLYAQLYLWTGFPG